MKGRRQAGIRKLTAASLSGEAAGRREPECSRAGMGQTGLVRTAEVDAIAGALGAAGGCGPAAGGRVLARDLPADAGRRGPGRRPARRDGSRPSRRRSWPGAGRRFLFPRCCASCRGSDGVRPAMVLEYVAGTPLSDVLAAGGDGMAAARRRGRAGDRGRRGGGIRPPGLLRRPGPRRAGDAAVVAAARRVRRELHGRGPRRSALTRAARRAWAGLCAAHAPALAAVDDQARLVHADVNPKNILVTRARGGWRVDAVLDWEFSFSGCPYARRREHDTVRRRLPRRLHRGLPRRVRRAPARRAARSPGTGPTSATSWTCSPSATW